MDRLEFDDGKLILDENNEILIKDKKLADQLKDKEIPSKVKIICEVKDNA